MHPSLRLRQRWLTVVVAMIAVVALVGGVQLLADELAADSSRADEGAARQVREVSPAEDRDVSPEKPRETTPLGDVVSVQVTVTIRNTGDSCRLPPESPAVLLGGDGRPLPRNGDAMWGPALSTPPPLERDGEAAAVLTWGSWCDEEDVGRWSVSLQLDGPLPVTPAGQDRPRPDCIGDGRGASYGLGGWTVLNEHGQPALDPQDALLASVTGPSEGRLGEVLPMTLRLANPTRGPIALDPCPAFVWTVDNSGPHSGITSSPRLELNCPAAPREIPSGRHVDFALELELSSALADGRLAPGAWRIAPALRNLSPREIRVLPAGSTEASSDCAWVVPPDANPRVTGLPRPAPPREAVLQTNRGLITVQLSPEAPCAVRAFAHLVAGGFWDGQRCYLLSTQPTFRNVDCGSADDRRVGFLQAGETRTGQDYPAGTVVLTDNASLTHAGSIRILYGAAPTYADNFTILGHVTDGLDVVEEVAAGGQKDGEWSGPALPLTIRGVALR